MKKIWQQITGQKHWPRFIRRVNISFRRVKRREVLTFLLFVAIASFFWIVQTSREESVQDFYVTLEVKNQPQDKVFTTHVTQQFKVSLSDTNAKLFNYGYNHRLETLSVDFDRYADALGNFRISAAELQSLISAQLMNTTRVVAVTPSGIDARFALTEGRKYPVRVKGAYHPAENYRLHDIILRPDSVTINAPSSVLDTLQYVYAIDSCYWGLRDTLRQNLALELPIGVKATPASVQVMVPVVQYVEKTFNHVVLQAEGVPQRKRMVVFPYTVAITCLVDFSSYSAITSDMFTATVSYADAIGLDGEMAQYLPIRVQYNGPTEAVNNIAVRPAMAEYVIE